MNEDKIKLAVMDIDEAIDTVSTLEKNINNNDVSMDNIKNKFDYLCQKVNELELFLKDEGIIE